MLRCLVPLAALALLAGCASAETSMPEPTGAWVQVNTPEFMAEGPDPRPAPRPRPPRVRRWTSR